MEKKDFNRENIEQIYFYLMNVLKNVDKFEDDEYFIDCFNFVEFNIIVLLMYYFDLVPPDTRILAIVYSGIGRLKDLGEDDEEYHYSMIYDYLYEKYEIEMKKRVDKEISEIEKEEI